MEEMKLLVCVCVNVGRPKMVFMPFKLFVVNLCKNENDNKRKIDER